MLPNAILSALPGSSWQSVRCNRALNRCSCAPTHPWNHSSSFLPKATATAVAAPTAASEKHALPPASAHSAVFKASPLQGAAPAAVPAPPSPQHAAAGAPRWQLISRASLAGGVLEVVQWDSGRNIRVWLPPGYSREQGSEHPWPVLYLNDGQNLFGDCSTLSGCSWQVAEAAAALITAGQLPPFLVVGLDHAGPLRSMEYSPYVPGSGPGGFRSDAANWPGGGFAAYLSRIKQEVLPWVAEQYAASTAPDGLAFGGSSFGGVAALAAGMKSSEAGGCPFGALLVESPSLWLADEAFLRDIQSYQGPWPERVYIGMGGREFSGTRGGEGREHDAHFSRYLQALYAALTEQGLASDRLAWTLHEEAAHTESAWAARLPGALQFIASRWWLGWLQRQGARGTLCTYPGVISAAAQGSQMLFFNRTGSSTLSKLPPGSQLKVCLGMNGWQQPVQLELQPVQTLLHHSIEPPAQLQQEVFKQWGFEPELQQHMRQKQLLANSTSAAGSDDWHVLVLPALPEDCSELNMAFSDSAEQVWDNNNNRDFHMPVQSHQPSSQPEVQDAAGSGRKITASGRGRATVALAALAIAQEEAVRAVRVVAPEARSLSAHASAAAAVAEGEAAAAVSKLFARLVSSSIGDGCGFFTPEALDRAQQRLLGGSRAPPNEAAAAAESAGQRFFFMPSQPIAGMPMALYINKAQINEGLRRAPNMWLQIGFNDWKTAVQKVPFRPSPGLWRSDVQDWWCCELQVPHTAQQGAFAISAVYNGTEAWDNNKGANFEFSVLPLVDEVVQAITSATTSSSADAGSIRYLSLPLDLLQMSAG